MLLPGVKFQPFLGWRKCLLGISPVNFISIRGNILYSITHKYKHMHTHKLHNWQQNWIRPMTLKQSCHNLLRWVPWNELELILYIACLHTHKIGTVETCLHVDAKCQSHGDHVLIDHMLRGHTLSMYNYIVTTSRKWQAHLSIVLWKNINSNA